MNVLIVLFNIVLIVTLVYLIFLVFHLFDLGWKCDAIGFNNLLEELKYLLYFVGLLSAIILSYIKIDKYKDDKESHEFNKIKIMKTDAEEIFNNLNEFLKSNIDKNVKPNSKNKELKDILISEKQDVKNAIDKLIKNIEDKESPVDIKKDLFNNYLNLIINIVCYSFSDFVLELNNHRSGNWIEDNKEKLVNEMNNLNKNLIHSIFKLPSSIVSDFESIVLHKIYNGVYLFAVNKIDNDMHNVVKNAFRKVGYNKFYVENELQEFYKKSKLNI